jgi:hypothetical protein
MKIPTLQGIIKRRILVNYCAETETIQKILPNGFRPKLHREKAIVGICLIRLEHIRPKFAPEFIGISSENAAHRIAVLWEDEKGTTKEGVYIPRRDTDPLINAVVSGKLFPGEHNRADFVIREDAGQINFAMNSRDKVVSVHVKGQISKNLPQTSIFSSLAEASSFFETGSLGYSATNTAKQLDAIVLQTKEWKVDALDVSFVQSSFYEDKTIFPPHSIEFDHALIMQNIEHEWHSAPGFKVD